MVSLPSQAYCLLAGMLKMEGLVISWGKVLYGQPTLVSKVTP